MRRPKAIILSLLLLGIGLLLCTVFQPTNVREQPFAIALNPQQHLIGKIYTPKNGYAPYPVMVLTHGVNASKEMMAPLAVELARRGIAAVTFDFGDFGESYHRSNAKESVQDSVNLTEARAILAFVRKHPERFDLNRIGIGGHSMGGTTALALAEEDNKLRSTILLGIGGSATPTLPKNLFFGTGLYEQLNPVWEMRNWLHEATGKDEENKFSGDFGKGTARMLTISPTSDHVTAPYNPLLLQQALAWAEKSLNVPSVKMPLVVLWYIVGELATFSGAIATSVCLIVWVTKCLTFPQIRRLVSLAIVVGACGSWSLGVTDLMSKEWASNLLLFCYALQLVTNYTLLVLNKLSTALRFVGLYSILLASASVLPALLNGSIELLKHPVYITNLPQFLLQWTVFTLVNNVLSIKPALFAAYSLELKPSYLYWLLLLLELVLPGITLTVVELIAVRVVGWLRQPFNLQVKKIGSSRTVYLLAVLLLVLVGILYQRFQAGMFTLAANKGGTVLELIVKQILLPNLAIILLLRSSGLRRLESKVFTFNGQ